MTEALVDYPNPENYRACYKFELGDVKRWYELDFARLVRENPDLALECCDLFIWKHQTVQITEDPLAQIEALKQHIFDMKPDIGELTPDPPLSQALFQGLVNPMPEDMYNDLLHSWHFWDKIQAMTNDTNVHLQGHGPYHAAERRLVENLKKYTAVFERLLKRFPEEAWHATIVAAPVPTPPVEVD